VPRGIDTAPLLAEAKRQLHEEADYAREAECLQRYAKLIGDDPGFAIPQLVPELCTPRILAMTHVGGAPIETVSTLPQATRDSVGQRLIDLLLRELLVFGWMQTDPNPANYRYDPATNRIVLLDFGATQPVAPDTAALYRGLLTAARDRSPAGALEAFRVMRLVDDATDPAHRDELLALFDLAAEGLLHQGPFDFADRTLLTTLRERGTALAQDRAQWRTPPTDTLFIQRKLGGTYHLCARLTARVDLAALVTRHL
jgi:predicted unusual protein kinase regulating ubiquinone biosynthesis (AarF/ABC1/UbiB family)